MRKGRVAIARTQGTFNQAESGKNNRNTCIASKVDCIVSKKYSSILAGDENQERVLWNIQDGAILRGVHRVVGWKALLISVRVVQVGRVVDYWR